jgi:hypothetical protein
VADDAKAPLFSASVMRAIKTLSLVSGADIRSSGYGDVVNGLGVGPIGARTIALNRKLLSLSLSAQERGYDDLAAVGRAVDHPAILCRAGWLRGTSARVIEKEQPTRNRQEGVRGAISGAAAKRWRSANQRKS